MRSAPTPVRVVTFDTDTAQLSAEDFATAYLIGVRGPRGDHWRELPDSDTGPQGIWRSSSGSVATPGSP